jgi:2-dehydropantoate 2-reductase
MNIVVYGAGAIGSLFGAILSKKNNVVLIGRKAHIETINKKGLKITGKTNLNIKIQAFENIKKLNFFPDLIIISVKAFDTEKAVKQILPLVQKNTYVMSLQNGLGNLEIIQKYLDKSKILACITTHGVIFSKSGEIIHSGIGKTVIGSVQSNPELKEFVKLFNDVGIKTKISKDVIKEIWIKAIINSSINPLTTFFECKNGYLIKNPILKNLVEKICSESTDIANSEGFKLSKKEMLKKTFVTIEDTKDNYSSMLQSYQKGKKTEINSINGFIFKLNKNNNIFPYLNKLLFNMVKVMSEK